MDAVIERLVTVGQPTTSDRLRLIEGAAIAVVATIQSRAAALDAVAAFPQEDVADLAAAGMLLAPFPVEYGGLGLGTEPAGAQTLVVVLRALGRGNLALGRLYEGHVNAVRLLARAGTPAQIKRAFADAASGQLIGLWVTDPPTDALQVDADGMLHGSKVFCSGAGHVLAAVVTLNMADGAPRLAYVSTKQTTVFPLKSRLQGMRAAVTGQILFAATRLTIDQLIGEPGAYLREPDFSAGAWRTSAVTCGGLEALVALAMQALVARGHADGPHQQARMGRAWIAQETARLWVDHAAAVAEAVGGEANEVVATVNFARLAVEAACLEAMTLVERSVGLAAFTDPNPIERVRRDLATYLRQPAPDDVLTEAASHIFHSRMKPV